MAQSEDQTSTRILQCPECGLTVHAPADAELPDEGPTCAMGHEPTTMVAVRVKVGGSG